MPKDYERFRKENNIPAIESMVLTGAGAGVGYSAIESFRRSFSSLSKMAINVAGGLSPGLRRFLTKHIAFSQLPFHKTELDVSLGLEQQIQTKLTESQTSILIDRVERKIKDLNAVMERVDKLTRTIVEKVEKEGGEQPFKEAFRGVFTDFRDTYFGRAVDASADISGLTLRSPMADAKDIRSKLSKMRGPHLEAFEQYLVLVKDQTHNMERAALDLDRDISGIIRTHIIETNKNRTGVIHKEGSAYLHLNPDEIVEEVAALDKKEMQIHQSLSKIKDRFSSIVNLKFATSRYSPRERFSSIKMIERTQNMNLTGSAAVMGEESVIALNKLTRRAYSDAIAQNIPGDLTSGELAGRQRRFVREIGRTVRDLQMARNPMTGKPLFQGVELQRGFGEHRMVVLRAVRNLDDRASDLIIRVPLPKRSMGVTRLTKGGKEFITRYDKMYDVSFRILHAIRGRQGWRRPIEEAQNFIDTQIDMVLNEILEPGQGLLPDIHAARQLTSRILPSEKHVYQGAFENLQRFAKLRKRDGAILALDTEFHKETKKVREIGWQLIDSNGNIVAKKWFGITDRMGAQRSENLNRYLQEAGTTHQAIYKPVTSRQLGTIVAELKQDLTHYNVTMVSSKNFNADGDVIRQLIKEATTDSRAKDVVRGAIARTNVIDANYLPGVWGEAQTYRGEHFFEFLMDYVKDPQIKTRVESRLRKMGIPGLNSMGFKVFLEGLHTAYQDSAMIPIMMEAIWLQGLKQSQGVHKFNAKINESLRLIDDGYLPEQLWHSLFQTYSVRNVSSSAAATNTRLNDGRHVFAVVSPDDEILTPRKFGHLFPGLTGKAKNMVAVVPPSGRLMRQAVNILMQSQDKVTGKFRLTLGQVVKSLMYDIPATTAVSLTEIIPSDSYVLAERLKLKSFPKSYSVVVQKINDSILRKWNKPGVTSIPVGLHGDQLIGWDEGGTRIVTFDDSKGFNSGRVTNIRRVPDGYRVTIKGAMNLKAAQSVFGARGAATVTPLSLKNIVPWLREEVDAFVAMKQKPNSSEYMTMLFENLFRHADSDPILRPARRDILKSLIKEHFKNPRKGKPSLTNIMFATDKRGMLSFADGNREFWSQFGNVDIGDYIQIADKYMERSGGTFNQLRSLRIGGRVFPLTGRQIGVDILKPLATMMTEPTALPANVEIARRNLQKVGKIQAAADLSIDRIAANVTAALEKQDYFGAIRAVRPDIDAKDMTKLLAKIPMMFWSTASRTMVDGRVRDAAIGVFLTNEYLMVKSPDITSGVSKIGDDMVRVGMQTATAVGDLFGAEKLHSWLLKKMADNPETAKLLPRMMPYAYSTGAIPTNMKKRSLEETAKTLANWLELPNTTKLHQELRFPMADFYEYGGRIFDRDSLIRDHGKWAIEEAKRIDPLSLKRRAVHIADVQEMLDASAFYLDLGRDTVHELRKMNAETQYAKVNRIVIAAARRDYQQVTFRMGRHGAFKSLMVESLEMQKLRTLLKTMQQGGLDQFNDAMKDWLRHSGSHIFKDVIEARGILGTRIQNVNLGGRLIVDMIEPGVTTTEKARSVLRSYFNTDKFNLRSFRYAPGMGENEMLSSMTRKKFNAMFNSMTPDDLKSIAGDVLSSERIGFRSGISPRFAMLRMIAGDLQMEGGPMMIPDKDRVRAKKLIEVLRDINAGKQVNRSAMRRVRQAMATGILPATTPVLGLKFPVVGGATKVFNGYVFVNAQREWTNTFADKYLNSVVGGMVIQHPASSIMANIDFDGDQIALLMGPTEQIQNMMKENTFLSALGDSIGVVESGGMVETFDKKTGARGKIPSAIANVLMTPQESIKFSYMREIMTKEQAGLTTIRAINMINYFDQQFKFKITGRSRELHKSYKLMREQVLEAANVLAEGTLKGKSATSVFNDEFMRRIGDPDFYKRVRTELPSYEELVANKSNRELEKLLKPIAGTNEIVGANIDTVELLHRSARGQFQAKTYFETMRMPSTRLPQLTEQLTGNIYIDGLIPTRFAEAGEEKLVSSMKRNIMHELHVNKWNKKLSVGMGWVVGLYAAYKLFQPESSYLGHMPGVGGEIFDWAWTRPEYQMAGLLDEPFKNPYDKNTAYVVMDKPQRNQKIERMLTRRERTDLRKIADIVGTHRPRTTSRFQSLERQRSNRELLERFGSQ